jgi:hypothetical protein
MPVQSTATPATWLAASEPWLLLVLALCAAGALAGIWTAVARLRALEGLGQRLDGLEEIRHAVARLASDRGDLDLRRLEHVLLELRDGQKRLEDALLARLQSPRSLEQADRGPGGAPPSLAERVTNRLLALGYERVRLVTPIAELEQLAAGEGGGSGELVVEARRDGVLCKGRVLLRRGALTDVEIQPAYKLFP